MPHAKPMKTNGSKAIKCPEGHALYGLEVAEIEKMRRDVLAATDPSDPPGCDMRHTLASPTCGRVTFRFCSGQNDDDGLPKILDVLLDGESRSS